MTTLNDPEVHELLEQPNYAVISTHNSDGSIHNTVVWVASEDGKIAVNSALGRRWPTNLERDPHVNVIVVERGNPYRFVEIRGTASAVREGAEEHIDALAQKYIGQDTYPYRQEGEKRIKFVIEPEHVRYLKQG